jgi:hypothetical protein
VRKSLRMAAAATLAGLLVAGASLAAPPAKDAKGEILAIDPMARTLVVKEGSKEIPFQLAPDVKIMTGPKPEQLANLKVGQQVKVHYVEDGGKNVAHEVKVKKK